MPTFKNCKPEALAAVKAYQEDQGKLQDLLNLWAPRFGLKEAVLRHASFDRTYFSGFWGGEPNLAVWRNDCPEKHRRPEWILRANVARWDKSPATIQKLKDFKALWKQMCEEIPFKHLQVIADDYLQMMGFKNHLDLYNGGRVSMVFTPEAVYLMCEHTLDACRVPDNGWEEILGSQYEAELAAAKLEEAHRRAEKEAAEKAMAESTAQNQKERSYD